MLTKVVVWHGSVRPSRFQSDLFLYSSVLLHTSTTINISVGSSPIIIVKCTGMRLLIVLHEVLKNTLRRNHIRPSVRPSIRLPVIY